MRSIFLDLENFWKIFKHFFSNLKFFLNKGWHYLSFISILYATDTVIRLTSPHTQFEILSCSFEREFLKKKILLLSLCKTFSGQIFPSKYLPTIFPHTRSWQSIFYKNIIFWVAVQPRWSSPYGWDLVSAFLILDDW